MRLVDWLTVFTLFQEFSEEDPVIFAENCFEKSVEVDVWGDQYIVVESGPVLLPHQSLSVRVSVS